MAITLKTKNFAKSELATSLAIGGMGFGVQSGEGARFPVTGSGNPFRAVFWSQAYNTPFDDPDREVVQAYRSTGDTFVITSRALENTVAKAWSIGDNFMLIFSEGKIAELEAEINSKGGAWTLVSYSTGTGSSISVSGLDLATDLEYMVLWEMSGSASSDSVRATVNNIASGSHYLNVGRKTSHNTVSLSSGDVNGLGVDPDAFLVLGDGPVNSASGKILFSLLKTDGTNARPSALIEGMGVGQDASSNVIYHYTGMGREKSQTNVTSLQLKTSGTSKTWKVWVLKPKTS